MWEIYAYQNADSLFGIFNAAAAIHGSGDYMAAVAAVAFCGFIAALVAYAFAPEKLQGWKWLATVLLVFSVLIVPRVTVGVVDKTGGSAVKVVANGRPVAAAAGARRAGTTSRRSSRWRRHRRASRQPLTWLQPCCSRARSAA
jgi:conjugal transfer mating pair stabilization protein TraG